MFDTLKVPVFVKSNHKISNTSLIIINGQTVTFNLDDRPSMSNKPGQKYPNMKTRLDLTNIKTQPAPLRYQT